MIKPIILSIDCVEHDPIEKWVPEDTENVSIWINIRIGINQSEGDYFQLKIVTPKRVLNQDEQYSLVVNEYSWGTVLIGVDKLLERCKGSDWEEISKKLSTHMRWEFESYRDSN